jgi:hypothetical protein
VQKIIALLTSLAGLVGAIGVAYSYFKPTSPPQAAQAAQAGTENQRPSQTTSGKNSPIIESNGPGATFTIGDSQK